jgi:hypothetical protein
MLLQHATGMGQHLMKTPQIPCRLVQHAYLRRDFVLIRHSFQGLKLIPELDHVGEHHVSPLDGQPLVRELGLQGGGLHQFRDGMFGSVCHSSLLMPHSMTGSRPTPSRSSAARRRGHRSGHTVEALIPGLKASPVPFQTSVSRHGGKPLLHQGKTVGKWGRWDDRGTTAWRTGDEIIRQASGCRQGERQGMPMVVKRPTPRAPGVPSPQKRAAKLCWSGFANG